MFAITGWCYQCGAVISLARHQTYQLQVQTSIKIEHINTLHPIILHKANYLGFFFTI